MDDMMERTDSDRIIADGSQARSLLADPLLGSVLGAMRRAVVDQFLGTSPDDSRARELLHHISAAQIRFEQTLRSMLEAADIELAYLNDEEMQRRANDLIDERVRSR